MLCRYGCGNWLWCWFIESEVSIIRNGGSWFMNFLRVCIDYCCCGIGW